MAASENKALVRRFYEEAWDQGKLDVIDELFAEDYVRHDLRATQALPGPEGMKRVTADFRAAFPDLHFDIEIVFAEGEFFAARWSASVTLSECWAEVEPTGPTARFSGVNIFRFEHGK